MSSHRILWCVDISTAQPDRILYRGWQLELFLFSMIEKGKINPEDICVTCYSQNLDFDLPLYYEKIFSIHPRVKIAREIDIGFSPLYHTIDRGPNDYCAINKSSALIPVYKNSFHHNYDVIALLDLDAFMFGRANYDAYPTTTTLTDYPPIEPKTFCRITSGLQGQEAFIDPSHLKDIWGNPWNGINMMKIMEAINVPKGNREKIKAGSYNIFIGHDDFTEELVYGFQYFTIALKALCAAAGHPFIWQAEMGAYPLALASYGIDYEISDAVEINDCPWHQKVVPEGTLCTYAFDGFSSESGSNWNKLNYMYSTPFDDIYTINHGLHDSNSDAERFFYECCQEIRETYRFNRAEL
ncbi:MAG TPA: hypothetical protein EYO59_04390 [Chromatiaceae bacterium]|nr:hypothetical protein [Chromatiaceae bacterium]